MYVRQDKPDLAIDCYERHLAVLKTTPPVVDRDTNSTAAGNSSVSVAKVKKVPKGTDIRAAAVHQRMGAAYTTLAKTVNTHAVARITASTTATTTGASSTITASSSTTAAATAIDGTATTTTATPTSTAVNTDILLKANEHYETAMLLGAYDLDMRRFFARYPIYQLKAATAVTAAAQGKSTAKADNPEHTSVLAAAVKKQEESTAASSTTTADKATDTSSGTTGSTTTTRRGRGFTRHRAPVVPAADDTVTINDSTNEGVQPSSASSATANTSKIDDSAASDRPATSAKAAAAAASTASAPVAHASALYSRHRWVVRHLVDLPTADPVVEMAETDSNSSSSSSSSGSGMKTNMSNMKSKPHTADTQSPHSTKKDNAAAETQEGEVESAFEAQMRAHQETADSD